MATLFGKWDESMHYVNGECSAKGKGFESLSEAHLLWKRSKPPKFPTRYNFTRLAITLNELTPELKVIVLICLCSFSGLHILFRYMHVAPIFYLHTYIYNIWHVYTWQGQYTLLFNDSLTCIWNYGWACMHCMVSIPNYFEIAVVTVRIIIGL